MENKDKQNRKLWGGRFSSSTSSAMDDFNASIRFDCRMYKEDIEGSIAHAAMLGEQGIISDEDAKLIVKGLHGILADAEAGKIEWSVEAEDIHMNVETLLTERIGEAGKRLHTGRSRNDQVALDTRMYVRNAACKAAALLLEFRSTLVSVAHANLESVMPGYTHMQKAQPVTLAHHMMAYEQMMRRDTNKFMNAAFAAASSMPLGSGAIAGTTFPLNRMRVAELLRFTDISENSMDAVSDRDYILDAIYACSVLMMHLSRLCEEIVLWSTGEFGFVTLSDGYSTGSSMMPNKKNPDAAELVRGKTGRVYGDLTALLTCMKGLPLTYNKDLQEDKEALFDALDTVTACLTIVNSMMAEAAFNTERMAQAAEEGFTNATDAADYLVKKGLPFREAHEVIGRIVRDLTREGGGIASLPIERLREYSPLFNNDVYKIISVKMCVRRRNLPGGPAPDAVMKTLESAAKDILAMRKIIMICDGFVDSAPRE
ncbi:MAG: argininosuccinate lyase [Oscillospiraceae bacterium]|nr:argininosuccinate lyase [Oscillospiraceae bacterium]